jgi:hypothetical protein
VAVDSDAYKRGEIGSDFFSRTTVDWVEKWNSIMRLMLKSVVKRLPFLIAFGIVTGVV